jgi:hypothetical protein
MGVVTCGKEYETGPFSRIVFQKNITEEPPRESFGPSEKTEFYETYISTTSPPQEISSWFSQTHANRKWP